MAKQPKKTSKAASVPPTEPQAVSYQKVILRPGTFRVPAKRNAPGAFQDESGKWVKEEVFSNDRLLKLEQTAAKMIGDGFKIPAPFAHRDENRRRVFPIKAGNDGAYLDALSNAPIAWNSAINGGFWRDLKYVADASKINSEFAAGPGLIGTVDTFGDPTDLNSPAGKVSRTVKDTSICVLPNYKPPMADEPYEDYIAHIAMPMHAIEPGQDNFAAEVAAMSDESEEELSVISMADLVTGNGGAEAQENDDPELVEVIGLLQQLKIDLPPDTNRDNLINVLRILLRQKITDQKEMTPANPLTQPPAGSTSKPAPVAMSDNNKVADALLLREQNRVKNTLRSRLDRLKSTVGLPPEVVQELGAEIESISMSAEDLNEETGDFPVSLAEKQIVLLERTRRPMTGSVIDDGDILQMSAPDGSRIEEPPVTDTELPVDYVAGIINRAIPIGA